MRLGLISDTHDLLRPEALEALAGCAAIVHAGDLCTPPILDPLERLAPVHAVRGNNDRGAWPRALPEHLTLPFGDRTVHVVHDLARLALDPRTAGVDLVVSGHSHRQRLEARDSVVFLNPGSAGPRRFRLPAGLAVLELERLVRLVRLDGGDPDPGLELPRRSGRCDGGRRSREETRRRTLTDPMATRRPPG